MSAKAILTFMLASLLVMGVIFYQSVKRAPEAQARVGDQMKNEFIEDSIKSTASDKMLVAETGSAQYFVSFKQPWQFQIQDQNLVVTVPPLQRVPPQASIPAEDLAIAQQKLKEFVLAWLKEKFPSQKDQNEMAVEIHFTPTAP